MAKSVKGYRVEGPGGKWCVCDHGDEMTVVEGPHWSGRTVARLNPALLARLDAAGRLHYVYQACSAIHTALLLGADEPTLYPPWVRR